MRTYHPIYFVMWLLEECFGIVKLLVELIVASIDYVAVSVFVFLLQVFTFLRFGHYKV